MPAIILDPNTLTKDRLKKELSKHDVSLPPSDAKKQIYVDLYRQHILEHVQRGAADLNFSSDEETTTPSYKSTRKARPGSPKKSPRKSATMSGSKDISPDIMQLTDAELLMQLTDRGVDVGPITDTTRKVYQRKLQTLLAGQPRLDASQEEEEEYSDEEVEEPVRPSLPEVTTRKQEPVLQSSYGRRSIRTAVQTDHAETFDSGMTSIRQRTVNREERIQQSSSNPQNKSEKVKEAPVAKSRLSIFAQIAIFLIIAIIVFLIIQNLDPNIKKPWITNKS